MQIYWSIQYLTCISTLSHLPHTDCDVIFLAVILGRFKNNCSFIEYRILLVSIKLGTYVNLYPSWRKKSCSIVGESNTAEHLVCSRQLVMWSIQNTENGVRNDGRWWGGRTEDLDPELSTLALCTRRSRVWYLTHIGPEDNWSDLLVARVGASLLNTFGIVSERDRCC